MGRKGIYLTIEQKKALALSGKDVPVCLVDSKNKNSFIAKLRGTIFDGSLKDKILHL